MTQFIDARGQSAMATNQAKGRPAYTGWVPKRIRFARWFRQTFFGY